MGRENRKPAAATALCSQAAGRLAKRLTTFRLGLNQILLLLLLLFFFASVGGEGERKNRAAQACLPYLKEKSPSLFSKLWESRPSTPSQTQNPIPSEQVARWTEKEGKGGRRGRGKEKEQKEKKSSRLKIRGRIGSIMAKGEASSTCFERKGVWGGSLYHVLTGQAGGGGWLGAEVSGSQTRGPFLSRPRGNRQAQLQSIPLGGGGKRERCRGSTPERWGL